MSNRPVFRRRFVVLMLVALVPITAGLFYVVTMQRAERSEVVVSQDRSTVGVRHEISNCGGDYRSVIRLWDSAGGEPEANWALPDDQWAFQLSPSGDRFLRHQSAAGNRTKVVVGTVADGPESETHSFLLPPHGMQNGIHWADDESKLIYEDYARVMRCIHVRDGKETVIQWDRPAQELSFYRQSADTLVSYNAPSSGREHSFQLVGDRLVLIGTVETDPKKEYLDFSPSGERVLVMSQDERQKTCRVVDVRSGKTITTIRADERLVSHWRVDQESVVCFYGDGDYDADGLTHIVGAQVFDAESGELKHDTAFSVRPEAIWYNARQQRYCCLVTNHRFVSFDLEGRRREVVPDVFRWWWPARVVFITLAVVWWLTWSFTLRRGRRSYQPLIDIAILQALVFVCSGVRLWAYVYGPDWSGYLHVWESVLFLGTGLSIVTWFLVWVLFGPQRWPIRTGTFVIGVAVVLGTILVIWEAGSNRSGSTASLAIAQTMIGTMTLLTVQLGLLWPARLMKVRLVHVTDTPASDSEPVRRQASIRDLLVWLVAFGILFTIIKLREIAIPQSDNIAELVTIGCVAGLVAALTLWLAMGSRLWRFPIIAAGYALACWHFYSIGRMEVLHVGLAWLPMILVPAAVFRWNGYALGRPGRGVSLRSGLPLLAGSLADPGWPSSR